MQPHVDSDPAIRVLTDGLAFLGNYGFEFREATTSISEASGRIFRVEYSTEPARRIISVTYYPDRRRAQASIRSTDDEFTFADAGAMYLREPRFEDASGEGLHRLNDYLAVLRVELETNGQGLLRGAPFQNDAFDWSPYK